MPYDGTEYQSDPALETIDRMGKLICDDQHWWNTGRLVVREGIRSYCPVTAMTQGMGVLCSAVNAHPAWCYIVKALPTGVRSVTGYNNAVERTFSDIQKLIARARELRLADMMEKVEA